MESARDIKRRIKSVKNIAQITKAMEAVSANKMRKSQAYAINARPYAVAALEMLGNLISRTPKLPSFFIERDVNRVLVLVITADKGLAGAYNSNVLRSADKLIRGIKDEGKEAVVMAVGKKSKEYFTRRGVEIIESFSGFGDYSEMSETKPIAKSIIEAYLAEYCDEAVAVYTNFKTTLSQEVVHRKILPVTKNGIVEMVLGILPEHGKYSRDIQHDVSEDTENDTEYIFEPSAEKILENLVPKLIAMDIHHIILEANASEHSSRMVAMKSASDNAKDINHDLNLLYNKVRQAGITRELSEITAGREALAND